MHALPAILAALAVAPGHAEIAFESGDAIWSSRSDGSERQLLVAASPGEELSEPAWSPDGTTLAFVRTIPGDEADQAQIMLRDAAGSRAVTPLGHRRGNRTGARHLAPPRPRPAAPARRTALLRTVPLQLVRAVNRRRSSESSFTSSRAPGAAQ